MEEPEILLETKRFRVVRRSQRLKDGRTNTREVIEHAGAVAIIPLLDERHVCLIRNYRLAIERWLIEIPAGTLEPGEDPLATAHRELAEETGYRAGKMTPLCGMYFSPGILREHMRFYVATELALGERQLDVGEQIETMAVEWNEALDMIRRGEIDDAKTVAGLLYCDRWVRLQGD